MIVYFLKSKRKLGESMNKKIFTALIVFTCFALSPITTSADFPTGNLGYSDEIAVDSEFEWTVKTLQLTGDITKYYDDDFYIGDTILEQGNKIRLVVLEDPDDAIGIWYDIYVDGAKVTNPNNIWLGYAQGYGYSDFFISPVTYTNTTGTYNLYEQIFEEFVADAEDYSKDETSNGYTYRYIVRNQYTLTGSTFTSSFYLEVFFGDNTNYMSVKAELEMSVNTENGLLGHSKTYIEIDMTMYGSEAVGTLDFQLTSKYTGIPFNWAFSFLGITVIAAVIALAKRKKK